ncbi:MAG: hypothetical protein ACXACR_03075 [Candidatus Hodarchaeales archaeon]
MVSEELCCPSCGNFIQIAPPSDTEIIHIKGKSFWNSFISSGLWKGNGTRMHTNCEHCDKKLSLWFRKKNTQPQSE